jgi:hypothetical protein
MSDHRYPHAVEPSLGFADRLEGELLRRLHDPADTAVAETRPADRSLRTSGPAGGADDQRHRRGGRVRRKRRLAALGIAASILVVVAIGILMVWQFPAKQDAAAAVRSAVGRQEDLDSYEARQTTTFPDGRIEHATGRVDGDDAEVVGVLEYPDGRTESMKITEVGELVYSSFNGENIVSPQAPDETIQPSIAELSRALQRVLDTSDVTPAGSEVVAGGEATRYEIELDDRARVALADPVLGFDPPRMERLTIWIADDYPRQLEWVLDDGEHAVLTLVSIGDDLDIGAPTGDYRFDPEPEIFNP